jgi:hypothetical protein
VSKVLRDQLVQLVFRVQLAQSVSLELLVFRVLKDQVVLPVPLALLELLVSKVLRDQLELLVFRVLKDQVVLPVPLALLEPQVFRAPLV